MEIGQIIQIFGTIVGVFYIYYQYKASPYFWYVSIISSLPFIYLYWTQGAYSSFVLYMYYLIVALKEVLFPSSSEKGQAVFVVRKTPVRQYPVIIGISLLLLGGLYWFRVRTGGDYAFVDAFATAFSFIGMWLLSKKYIENWIVWGFVNIAFVMMSWQMKTYGYVALYALFGLMSVLGYLKWASLMRKQNAEFRFEEDQSVQSNPLVTKIVYQIEMTLHVTESTNKPIVILADGEFPRREETLNFLREANFVACCDGAALNCVKFGVEPNVIVGDGDSLDADIKERYHDRIIRIPEQETNDLTKTFKYVRSLGYEDIVILGATGLREDHTIANVSLLADYASEARVRMISDYGVFHAFHNRADLTVRVGQEVSIISLGAKGFKGEGLEYPLYDFTKWWQGTLNKALAERITITAEGTFIVYVAEED